MSKTQVINIGILGVASIALRFMLPAIQNLSDLFYFSGFASEYKGSLKKGYDVDKFIKYESYEALIDDNAVDAVYVALPNALHHKYVTKALKRGKHVIVEKPAGCSEDEIIELVALAKSLNLVLLENFQFKFHSQLKLILNYLNQGLIGELRSVRVSFGFPPFSDQNNIRYDPCLGGGAFLACGVYALMIAPFFLGNDIKVVQASISFDEARGVDIWGGGTLKQRAGNLFCHFSFGFDNFYQCSLELWGSRGRILASRIFTAPPDLSPEIVLHKSSGTEVINAMNDNHFVNILVYFHELIYGQSNISVEYENLIRQGTLMGQFLHLINDKKLN